MRPVFIHSENEREFRLFQSTERDWAAYPRSPFVLRDRVWEASPNSLCEKFPIKGLAREQIFVPFSVYNFTRDAAIGLSLSIRPCANRSMIGARCFPGSRGPGPR